MQDGRDHRDNIDHDGSDGSWDYSSDSDPWDGEPLTADEELRAAGVAAEEFNVLAWWADLRARMTEPAEFGEAAAAVSPSHMAWLAEREAASRATGILCHAPERLDRAERLLVAVASAMMPRGAVCVMDVSTIRLTLSGVLPPTLCVPLYLGSALHLEIPDNHAERGGYIPGELPGLESLDMRYVGGRPGFLPRLHVGLRSLRLRRVRLDQRWIGVEHMELEECEIIEFDPPTRELSMIACVGDVAGMAQAAAGVCGRVVIVGAAEWPRGSRYPILGIDYGAGRPPLELRGRFGELSVRSARVSGVVQARTLKFDCVEFAGLEAEAGEALLHGVRGGGRLTCEAIELKYAMVRGARHATTASAIEWLARAGATIATPDAEAGAGPADAPRLVAPRVFGLGPDTEVAGVLVEASFSELRLDEAGRSVPPRAAALDRGFACAARDYLRSGHRGSFPTVADAVDSGRPRVARAAALGDCPEAEFEALCLAPIHRGRSWEWTAFSSEQRVRAGLLVVRADKFELSAMISGLRLRRQLTADRLLVVVRGDAQWEIGELAALLGGAELVGRDEAADAGIPAHWLDLPFRL